MKNGKPVVYLAGPILGCDKSEANDWRREVADKLAICGIVGISPLRCEPLVGDRYAANHPDPKFGTARAIGAKNMFDVQQCEIAFVYLPKPEEGRRQSYGSLIEIGIARGLDKPVIVVTDDPFIKQHPVLNAFAAWVLDNLDDGIDVCAGLLAGYAGGKNV
jgi:nucleoside 2-deoxyribosyltransferase